MSTSSDPLTRLRELLDAASPGPWDVFPPVMMPRGVFDPRSERFVEISTRGDVAAPGLAILNHLPSFGMDCETNARAIAAWMNLRGPVMAVLEGVINHEDDTYGVRCAVEALLADIEKEVPGE